MPKWGELGAEQVLGAVREEHPGTHDHDPDQCVRQARPGGDLADGVVRDVQEGGGQDAEGQSGGDAGAPAAGLMPGGDRVKTPCNRQFSDI